MGEDGAIRSSSAARSTTTASCARSSPRVHVLTKATPKFSRTYEEHGVDFASRLNGIFAIALWDGPRKRLLLVRDRVGIKPLFYAIRGGVLRFGSEVKCILAAGGSDLELDLLGLDQLLSFEYTASPTTLLRDVRKLPPGGWLTWDAGEVRSGTYWSLPPASPAEERSEEDWASELRSVLDRAVERQMVSDVPLGALLSGGIDSSIVVGAMSRAASGRVLTFSIGFADRTYDELPWARIVAERFGTEHEEAILEPSYLDLVPEVIEHLDQPIADFSVFPTLLVSRVARRKVTVALSGDGGDELFAGYDAYAADRAASATLDRLPRGVARALRLLASRVPYAEGKKGLRNTLRRFLEGAALPPAWQHMRWMTFLTPEQAETLYRPEVAAEVRGQAATIVARYLDNGGGDRVQRQLFCDTLFYLPENILVKVDLMGMATSLENRVPFLDNEVIDLAARMPSAMKLRRGERKHVLKKAYADVLPEPIAARGKQGFSIPLKSWLNREWKPLLRDVLAEETLRRDGLFRPEAVERLIREHESRRENHSHLLWALMVFQLWKARFA
jgi:asparagine synthase (glutamine-hydrolysing)